MNLKRKSNPLLWTILGCSFLVIGVTYGRNNPTMKYGFLIAAILFCATGVIGVVQNELQNRNAR